MNYIKTSTIFLRGILSILIVFFCISHKAQTSSEFKNSFNEVFKDFPRQEKNLRKWDAPVIVDLDKDGYLDLLINDHGLGIQVCWNNQGKFAKPYDVIMGDLHGVSAGDFDNDGNIEVIMSRGGGSGSNARNSKLYRIKKRKFIPISDFKVPLELMRGRTVKWLDINNDGSLDLLNFAFPDRSKKGVSENYIYKNDGKGELTLNSTLPPSKRDGQKSIITDFNGDNISDIILYGNENVKGYKGNGDFTFVDVSKEIFPYPINEVRGVVEIDFDNDGDLDLYFARGFSFEKGETFYNKETKVFGFYTKRGQFEFDIETGDILKLENIQSQWPNNDTYYIGESSYDYKFEGETHSGKDIHLVNSNALGFPDNPDFNKKKGIYIGYIGNKKWKVAGYLWAPGTGTIHNVKSYPKAKHKKGLNNILLENTGNKFKDITKKMNLFNEEHTMGVAVSDFDNNGFQDLIIVKRGNLVSENESLVYLNKGNTGFEKLKKHNITSKELGVIGMTIETIDYNKDGNVDVIIGNERGKWHLFKNELSSAKTNNYLTIEVGNSPSKKATALGAIVEIKNCGLKQIKRIGSSGANYSRSFNNQIHFGLATCTKNIEVKVTWSNGETKQQKITRLTNKNVLIGK